MNVPPFPSGDDVGEVADWVELHALSKGRAFKRGTLTMTLEREDAKVEAGDVFDELERRYALMGSLWPLGLDDDADARVVKVRNNAPGRALYTFLAALGLRQNITPDGRVLFEECVTELAAALTGRRGLRLGFPRKAPVPVSLRDAVDLYCAESAEMEGKMKAPPLTDGDLGMDIATWFPFRDNRGGYLHLIGQCATGADWPDKLTELNPHKWSDHVNWAVSPVRFFALPYVVSVQDFRRASMDGGIVLDRARLMELCRARPLPTSIVNRVRTYTEQLYN